MSPRLPFLSAVIVAVTLGLASPVRAGVVFADNFESQALGLNALLDNWTVSDGTIDVVGTAFFQHLCVGSSSVARCIDLDGSTMNAGTITSTAFQLVTGTTYDLSFWLGNNPAGTNTMDVTIGSAFAERFSMPASFTSSPGLLVNRSFLYSGPTGLFSLAFAHHGGDQGGLVIDDVLLTSREPSPTSVPEPASLSMLALGAGAIAVARRRRG